VTHDWLAAWDAADETDRAAACACVDEQASTEYGDRIRKSTASGWHAPNPEVVDARRDGNRLIAALAWTYWVGDLASGSEQTIGIHQVTVEHGAVIRDRRLATGTLTTNAPRDQHDAMQAYRDRLPGLRDLATAVAHIAARLDAICDAAPEHMGYVVRDVVIHVIQFARDEDRLVATTLGWYRLGQREQVGSDRITRYIDVDEITVEHGVVVGERSIVRTQDEMSEYDSDNTELANRLDEEHVSSVIARCRSS
jgi:hypothetical protein